ncbi:hypothetical protein [Flagellimonas iocasae]|uniref:Outer membrane protein beta-barrel domain-containing protein n=1 Tax=Flagellimonas iocasae TaxID=2055905 RepID=A0ABW4XW01_9FLAO
MSKQIFRSTIIVLMVFAHLGYGQIGSAPATLQETPLTIEGYDFPTFDGLSNYAWFKVNLALTDRTEFSIGGEHYRRPFADRFTIPIQMKQYLNDKTYILGGYQWEWDLMNIGLDMENMGKGHPNPKPRQDFFYGIGHDVSPNMMIEAKIVQPVGTPEFYDIGLEGAKTRLKLGTRLKF